MAQAARSAGRIEALHEVCLCFVPLLLRCCRGYCHPHSGCRLDCQVGDLFMEGYLALGKLLETWEPGLMGFPAYAGSNLDKRIASAFGRMQHRADDREGFRDLVEELPDSASVNPACLYAVRRLLEQALEPVAEQDRKILRMHFGESRTFAEVAQTLDLSVSGAEKRSSRSIRTIRQRLGIRAEAADPRHEEVPGHRDSEGGERVANDAQAAEGDT